MNHIWFTWHRDYKTNRVCCVLCGVIQRKDGMNSPCKGLARVKLRDASERAARKVFKHLKDEE